MKKLRIKKFITTSILNIGFCMESVTDTPVNRSTIDECITFISLSEKLINPGARLKIILASEEPIKAINIKITSVVNESKGIKKANVMYNKAITIKVLRRGLNFMAFLDFIIVH